MPESKYEPVEEIKLGRQANPQSIRQGMEVLELSSLKAENKAKGKQILEQKKEIDDAIKNAKNSPLPKKTLQRFDREFGKQKEKNAFKTAMVLFAVAIIISFILQPSIFFVKNGDALLLSNYSQREIKNVSIYSFNDLISGNDKPLFFIQKLQPKTTLPMANKETAVLIAFADRQLPAIGVYTLPKQNINNDGNVTKYKTGQTAEEMYNQMIDTNRTDVNG